MILKLPKSFHKPPKGFHYEIKQFNTKFDAIWICYERNFDYNLGEPVSCIWGFVSRKTGEYHSPINSKKPGKLVNFLDTRAHTSMPLKLNPLEMALLS